MFCRTCGKELMDEAVICPGCGCSTGTNMNFGNITGFQNQQQFNNTQTDYLLKQISDRYKINGIIWVVIACIQILLGITVNWIVLIIGILNLFSAISDINYSNTVLTAPKNIVSKVRSLTSPIITLVYNIIFGGIVGIIGSVYYLTAIRSFVLQNEASLVQFEENKAV